MLVLENDGGVLLEGLADILEGRLVKIVVVGVVDFGAELAGRRG